MSFKSASGTKSLISGDVVVGALAQPDGPHLRQRPDRLGQVRGEPLRLPRSSWWPRRPAQPPSLPVCPLAGATSPAAFWLPCSTVLMVSPHLIFCGPESPLPIQTLFAQPQSCAACRIVPFLRSSSDGLALALPRFTCAQTNQTIPATQHQLNANMKAVKRLVKARVGVPRFAQFHARIGQRKTPRPRAHKGINVKAQLRHLGNARGKRDERAHHRQQAPHQHRNRAVLLEKTPSSGPGRDGSSAPTCHSAPPAAVRLWRQSSTQPPSQDCSPPPPPSPPKPSLPNDSLQIAPGKPGSRQTA